MNMDGKPWGLAVRAVIFDREGRCLLIRRSALSSRFAGVWEWPGGKLEPGEDFASGLLREVGEETGLTVELTEVAGAASFELPDIRVALLCMEARIVSGDLKLSEEHDAFAWVPLAELSRYAYPPRISELMLGYAERKAGAGRCS